MDLSLRPVRARRVGRLHASDLLLGSALLVAGLGAIVTGEVDEGRPAVTVPVVVVGALAVALRRVVPLAAAAGLCLADLVQTLATGTSPGTLMSLAATLVLAWTLGAELDEALAAVGLTLMLSTSFAMEWHDGGHDYAFLTMEIGGAWLLGRAARSLRTRASYAEQHQRDLARLAVAEERNRIARELHDVVAHSLSIIAVQADAAEAALQRDPSRAGAPMRAIRTSARGALSDMRQLLHVMRGDEDTSTEDRHPVRGADDLDRLVEEVRVTGQEVTIEHGRLDRLPAGVSLATYRIVQEALTNARKHAGGAVTHVSVRREHDQVFVTARNGTGRSHGQTPGGGHGLLGARERAEATGGWLTAASTDDGGFEVRALLFVADTPDPGSSGSTRAEGPQSGAP